MAILKNFRTRYDLGIGWYLRYELKKRKIIKSYRNKYLYIIIMLYCDSNDDSLLTVSLLYLRLFYTFVHAREKTNFDLLWLQMNSNLHAAYKS